MRIWIYAADQSPAALEHQWIGQFSPTLVFLHEGPADLPVARFRRRSPRRRAAARGYDRYGYGKSGKLREARVGVESAHDGRWRAAELLENLNIENRSCRAPGRRFHCAGFTPGRTRCGVAVMALHVFS
jgi:pimeloyl-ACP methyl ester carboxylesterase